MSCTAFPEAPPLQQCVKTCDPFSRTSSHPLMNSRTPWTPSSWLTLYLFSASVQCRDGGGDCWSQIPDERVNHWLALISEWTALCRGSWAIEHYWFSGLGVTIMRSHIRRQQTQAVKTAHFSMTHTHTEILFTYRTLIASLSSVFGSTCLCSPYLPYCQYRQPSAPLGAWGGIDIQLKPTALSGVQGVAHELCMSWRQGAEQHQCHHNWNNWKDNARWVNN